MTRTGIRGAVLAGALILLAAVLPSGASALTPPPPKADLVFESGGRIMSMNADGTGRDILTREGLPFDGISENADSEPQVSPDGTAIVFSRYFEDEDLDSVSQIIVADRDGENQKVFLPNAAAPASSRSSVASPVWSADSSRIFYIHFDETRRSLTAEIRSIRADGTDVRLIGKSVTRFSAKKITGAKSLPFEIAPSPDGDRLLVSYYPIFGGAKPANSFLIDLASRKRKLLERDASSGDWSPDGSRIVFVSERDHLNKSCYEGSCSYDPQLFVMKADGSAVRRLIPGKPKGSSFSPDWSADGRRVAFSSDRIAPNRHVSDEIFSISPLGECLTRLTNGSPSSGSPAWGPGTGRSSEPEACGDAAPRAIAEYEPDANMLALKTPPLWLGSSFGNTLLDYMFKDGRAISMSYWDCGALNAKRCARPVSLDSGPVCEKLSDSVFYDGTFRRLVERRGALVMLAGPSGGGLETIAYSGGAEAGIYTSSTYRGKKVKPAEHLALVDLMRPVTSTGPVAKLEPPVFALSEVKLARAVLASWRDDGTLADAAADRGMFPRMAGAYLRFGKALERTGKVLTVKCKGHSNVPGSVKLR